jgi:hypothetical protein
MKRRSIVKAALAFRSGSMAIPTAAKSLVPARFDKGYLRIPFWEGIPVVAIALVETG